MGDFERVPMEVKRQGLVDLITDIASNHGETFNVRQTPTSLMLDMSDRASRMSFMENSNNEIRYCEVYYDGFEDPESSDDSAAMSTMRNDQTQHGSVDTFKVRLMYGVSSDPNTGEVVSFAPWERLLTAYSPMGIFPTLREKRYIQPVVQGDSRLVYLSLPRDLAYPNIPRQLMGSGDERAHYVDFSVTIIDS